MRYYLAMASEMAGGIDARAMLDRVLEDAVARGASDVHLAPTAEGYDVLFRIDGMLETISRHDAGAGRALVNRLMVLGQLLTYRLDVPQEGRVTMALPAVGRTVQMRLGVIPTKHGLRAVVRLPADLLQPRTLEELGLPPGVMAGLLRFVKSDAGMLAVTGPAGSGKTTTIYALLRKIVETSPGTSVISLEDPVERDIAGVTQIEVSPFGELTYERALRSILRQDPQVLMLGEIRDGATASLAVQAALSGHRLICTLHASDPAGALARLLEMGIEPYQVTSAVFGVVAQRLVRRIGDGGYKGRAPVAEFVAMEEGLRQKVLVRADAGELRKAYEGQKDHEAMRAGAQRLVEAKVTDSLEVIRVLGPN